MNYILHIRNIQVSVISIDADTLELAIELVKAGGGKELETYPSSLSPDDFFPPFEEGYCEGEEIAWRDLIE
jgi:hypothetical protein